MSPKKLLALYAVTCLLPYTPFLVSISGVLSGWDGLGVLMILLLGAGVVALGNLIAGPFLFKRLEGQARQGAVVCFILGAVFPAFFALFMFLG
ncbi:MAG: hypothetical protein ACPGO3_05885 [Magnetospiraceae bacterium]